MSAYLRDYWFLTFLLIKLLRWMGCVGSPTRWKSCMYLKMRWPRWRRLITSMNCRFLSLAPTDYGLVILFAREEYIMEYVFGTDGAFGQANMISWEQEHECMPCGKVSSDFAHYSFSWFICISDSGNGEFANVDKSTGALAWT